MMRGVVSWAPAGLVALAFGCGSFDQVNRGEHEHLAERGQAVREEPIEEVETPFDEVSTEASKAEIHPSLVAEMEREGTFGVRKVVLHVAEDIVSVAKYTGGEFGEATVEDGVLVSGMINGVPTDNEGFALAAEEMRKGFVLARLEAEAGRRKRWQQLASELDLGEALDDAILRGTTSAEVALSLEDIYRAGELESSLLTGVTLPTESVPAYIPISQALDSIDITTLAHPAGWNGSGIGVYSVDKGYIQRGYFCVNTSLLTEYVGFPPDPNAVHGTQMVCTIQATAPGARVFYGYETNNSCSVDWTTSAIPDGTTNPRVWVSHMALNSNSFNDGYYETCDRDYDNRVMLSRIIHVNSTGNENTHVSSPAVAFNVLSVGASNANATPNAMMDYSNYINPETGATKPDAVAPGHEIQTQGLSQSGTSSSSAMAAGFVADLMEQFASFRGRPALLKSYLAANAVRLTGSGIMGERDGYGQLDYSTAQYGQWQWWDGPWNTSFFDQDLDADGDPEIVVYRNVPSTGTYRAVISWLANGGVAYSFKKAHLNLDLHIYNPAGQLVGASVHSGRNVEGVEFNATTTGSYKIVIEKVHVYGHADLVLGFTFRKR